MMDFAFEGNEHNEQEPNQSSGGGERTSSRALESYEVMEGLKASESRQSTEPWSEWSDWPIPCADDPEFHGVLVTELIRSQDVIEEADNLIAALDAHQQVQEQEVSGPQGALALFDLRLNYQQWDLEGLLEDQPAPALNPVEQKLAGSDIGQLLVEGWNLDNSEFEPLTQSIVHTLSHPTYGQTRLACPILVEQQTPESSEDEDSDSSRM